MLGLQVLLNYVPLDMAQKEATLPLSGLGAGTPTPWDGIGDGTKRGHLFLASREWGDVDSPTREASKEEEVSDLNNRTVVSAKGHRAKDRTSIDDYSKNFRHVETRNIPFVQKKPATQLQNGKTR